MTLKSHSEWLDNTRGPPWLSAALRAMLAMAQSSQATLNMVKERKSIKSSLQTQHKYSFKNHNLYILK